MNKLIRLIKSVIVQRKFLSTILIFIIFNSTIHSQCLMQSIYPPYPSEKFPIVVYALRPESIYNSQNMKVDFSIERKVFKKDNRLNSIYNMVFSVTGLIGKSVIPDLAEITLLNGNTVLLYIPQKSGYHVSETGLAVISDCYNEFSETSSEIQLLLSYGIKRIKLEDQTNSIVIKQLSSDFFRAKLKCLLDKDGQ